MSSTEKRLKILRDMMLIRRFEESAGQMYGLRKIGGFCHLYIGQEAVAAGTIHAIDLSTDHIFTAYRDHGHALVCGTSAQSLMAELYGKSTGCAKGKGGSMHFFDAQKHMHGGNGIVGAHLPLATGAALALKYQKIAGVVLCFFGDGAIHQGAFHESLNLARIWNLPVIFICENNQYGMGTFYKRVSSVEDYTIMGDAYNIPAMAINGMDVQEVYTQTSTVVEQVRKQHTPYLLEIKTYRYKGHSMSDPGKYRSKDELEDYKKQDPILIFKEQLLATGELQEGLYEQMDQAVKDEVRVAVDFAEQSPDPELSEAFTDLYV